MAYFVINRLRGTCWLPLILQDLENSDTEERQGFEEQAIKVILVLMKPQALKESVSSYSPAETNGGEKSKDKSEDSSKRQDA